MLCASCCSTYFAIAIGSYSWLINTEHTVFHSASRPLAPLMLETLNKLHSASAPHSPFNHMETLSSVQFSRSVVSDSLRPHESQHTRQPCPSPTPTVHSDSRPSSRWCHPAISSSVVSFSSCPQSLSTSGSFPMSQLFTSGGQSFGVSASASVLPVSIQDWFHLGLTS